MPVFSDSDWVQEGLIRQPKVKTNFYFDKFYTEIDKSSRNILVQVEPEVIIRNNHLY